MRYAPSETHCRSRRDIERLVSVQDTHCSFNDEYVLVLSLVKVNWGAVAGA